LQLWVSGSSSIIEKEPQDSPGGREWLILPWTKVRMASERMEPLSGVMKQEFGGGKTMGYSRSMRPKL
jgi:hypothetical protein